MTSIACILQHGTPVTLAIPEIDQGILSLNFTATSGDRSIPDGIIQWQCILSPSQPLSSNTRKCAKRQMKMSKVLGIGNLMIQQNTGPSLTFINQFKPMNAYQMANRRRNTSFRISNIRQGNEHQQARAGINPNIRDKLQKLVDGQIQTTIKSIVVKVQKTFKKSYLSTHRDF